VHPTVTANGKTFTQVEVWDYEVEKFSDPAWYIEKFFQHPNGDPIVLYDFQRDYVRDFVNNIICVKARQVGFSYSSAFKALYLAMTRPGLNIVLISLTFPQALNFLKHAKIAYQSFPDRILVKSSTGGADYVLQKIKCDITNDKMTFRTNNSVIVSLPNNPVTVRGYTADWVFWDEAAKFPHEGDMRAALLPTITRKGLVAYISTHRGTSTQFYMESIRAKRDSTRAPGEPVELEGYRYFEIPYWVVKDPAYLKGVEKFKHQFGEDSFFFREEFCCIAVDESVAMFTHDMIEKAHDLWTKHNCQYQMPTAKHKVYAGIDIGRTQDVTVVYAIEDFGEYAQVVWVEEWQGRPFPEQKALLRDVIERINPTFIRIDHTGLGMQLAEELGGIFGAKVEGVDFTLPNKDMLMINTYIQMRNFHVAIPTDEVRFGEKLENQLRNVHRERSERSGQPKYVPLEGQMADDHLWAFCLAASLLTNPNPSTVAFVLGDKGKDSTIFADDTGKFVKQSIAGRYGERSLTYSVGASGTSREARELNLKVRTEAKKWATNYDAPKTMECPTCKASKKTMKGKDGVERPCVFVLQNKTPVSMQYTCEGCFTDKVIVRR